MLSTKNLQAKEINQKRGPTTGNNGTPGKRNEFMDLKASSGSEKAVLAKMVTDALEMRGRGQAPSINPALEGLHSNTGPKKNPTADGARLPGKYKSPKK
jgi:hypothetical protein